MSSAEGSLIAYFETSLLSHIQTGCMTITVLGKVKTLIKNNYTHLQGGPK